MDTIQCLDTISCDVSFNIVQTTHFNERSLVQTRVQLTSSHYPMNEAYWISRARSCSIRLFVLFCIDPSALSHESHSTCLQRSQVKPQPKTASNFTSHYYSWKSSYDFSQLVTAEDMKV